MPIIEHAHCDKLNTLERERSLDDAGKDADKFIEARPIRSKTRTSEWARGLPVLQEEQSVSTPSVINIS